MSTQLSSPSRVDPAGGSRLARVGVALACVIAAGDLALVAVQVAGSELIPIIVGAVIAGLALGTFVLAPQGWRGRRPALYVIAGLRGLSALTAIPAFVVDGVPFEMKLLAGAGLGLALVVIMLLLIGSRR
ncbi:hypothetical protein [Microlunatus sp. GCM10028923]|uniref:hypothetical protein n=1 Tax=Microlunatus sp. GCM10028923 TaxID=3273400 RepID=UPI0036224804